MDLDELHANARIDQDATCHLSGMQTGGVALLSTAVCIIMGNPSKRNAIYLYVIMHMYMSSTCTLLYSTKRDACFPATATILGGSSHIAYAPWFVEARRGPECPGPTKGVAGMPFATRNMFSASAGCFSFRKSSPIASFYFSRGASNLCFLTWLIGSFLANWWK